MSHEQSVELPWYAAMTTEEALAAPTLTYQCLSRFCRGKRHWDDSGKLPLYERASFFGVNAATGRPYYPGALEARKAAIAAKAVACPAIITFDMEGVFNG